MRPATRSWRCWRGCHGYRRCRSPARAKRRSNRSGPRTWPTCVIAALPGGAHADRAVGARYELAGPQTLTYEELVACALRSFGRRRRILKVPAPVVRRSLNALELLTGPAAFATWDEAELLEVSLIAPAGNRRRRVARRDPEADRGPCCESDVARERRTVDLGLIALILAAALLGPALTLLTRGAIPAVIGRAARRGDPRDNRLSDHRPLQERSLAAVRHRLRDADVHRGDARPAARSADPRRSASGPDRRRRVDPAGAAQWLWRRPRRRRARDRVRRRDRVLLGRGRAAGDRRERLERPVGARGDGLDHDRRRAGHARGPAGDPAVTRRSRRAGSADRGRRGRARCSWSPTASAGRGRSSESARRASGAAGRSTCGWR